MYHYHCLSSITIMHKNIMHKTRMFCPSFLHDPVMKCFRIFIVSIFLIKFVLSKQSNCRRKTNHRIWFDETNGMYAIAIYNMDVILLLQIESNWIATQQKSFANWWSSEMNNVIIQNRFQVQNKKVCKNIIWNVY